MRNLVFVTVGTSALDAAGRRRSGPPELVQLGERVREFKRNPTDEEAWKFHDPLFGLHCEYWKGHARWDDPGAWRETSAELITTATLLRKLKEETALRVDRVILLVTKTPDGGLAGALVKAVMGSDAYRRHVDVPEVIVRHISGITAAGSVEHLPDELLQAVNEQRDSEIDRVVFNVTAGFGGTGVLIGMLAVRHGFRIYYQHESMKSPIFIAQNLRIGRSPEVWMIGSI